MKKTLLGTLLLTLAVAGLALADQAIQELPLATVNEEPIFTGDLERQLGRMHSSVETADRGDFDTERLMFKLVNDALIGQEARAAGMTEEPAIVSKLAEYRDELILEYIQKVEISDRLEPSPEALRALYEEQYAEMQLRVVTTRDEAAAAETLAELREGADMETLARERSVDNIRARGGLMRKAPRIKLPRKVSEAAVQLAVGELGGPVRTDLGWTVFRVEAKSAADPAKFDELEGGVRSVLRNETARSLRAALAKTLRERHEVLLDRERLDRMKPVPQADGRLAAEAPEPQQPVARVGEGWVVTAEEYARALSKRWRSVVNEEAALAAAPIILDRMVERLLLLAEGERRGYGDLPRIKALVRARETQLLVPLYLEEVLASGIEVTQEEIHAYYDEHKDQFLQPPRVRLGQVTVETPEKADTVATMLRGGADLAWVAEQHSIDGYKDKGGLADWIVPQPDADPLQDDLLTREVGAVLDPVGPEGNVVVLKVVAREEQGPYPLERISGNVRQAVFMEKSRTALDRFIKTLRERSEIVIYDDRIRALNLTGTFEEQEEKQGAMGGHGH